MGIAASPADLRAEPGQPPHRRIPVWQSSLSGLLAGAALIGVAQLVAALIDTASAPLVVIGSTIIDHTPDALREWAIQTLGTNDKPFLIFGMAAGAVVVAGLLGVLEGRQRLAGCIAFATASAIVAVVAIGRPNSSLSWLFPSVVGGLAAALALRALIARAGKSTADSGATRRDFFKVAGLVALGSATAGGVGRYLGTKFTDVSSERAQLALPVPTSPSRPLPDRVDLRSPGLSSFVTSNADFYRIDISLLEPRVARSGWSLRIHGMVENEINLTFDDLLKEEIFERFVTLTCVSNTVGGPLIGNAKWLGVPIRNLLKRAEPSPEADMVLSSGVDGFSAGTPLEVMTDDRDALLAFGMNGEPLPVAHGYPARLVVPGLYGYVSATKWITDIEVTRFDRAEGYWTPRGWSALGPIKTASRIDTPRNGVSLPSGPRTIAGVAWAQHRGIEKVEIQIDNGDWQAAELSTSYSKDTWRQWALSWEPTPGPHVIRVRATDGTGEVQTARGQGPVPDGATGYHEISVRIS